MSVSLRVALVATLALIAGCDAVGPASVSANAETVRDQRVSSRPVWGTLATFTVSDHTLDVYYTVSRAGQDVPHNVTFRDEKGDPIIEYRYVQRSTGGYGVEARWPGVPSASGTLKIYHGAQTVYSEPVASATGQIGGWANFGDGDTPGKSIHVRRGEVRIDNNRPPPDVGKTAPVSICEPPVTNNFSGGTVSCSEYEVEFPVALPVVATVEVQGPLGGTVFEERTPTPDGTTQTH